MTGGFYAKDMRIVGARLIGIVGARPASPLQLPSMGVAAFSSSGS